MIKDILYPLNNQLTGPITKPLIANNNDYMGNSLTVNAELYSGSTSHIYISSATIFSYVQNLSSDFLFDGNTFTATSVLTIFESSTQVRVTATGIGDALNASSSNQSSVMGIRYEGSGPTIDYQGVNSWTRFDANSIALTLSNSPSLPSWVSNGNAWGVPASNLLSDNLTVTLLSVA